MIKTFEKAVLRIQQVLLSEQISSIVWESTDNDEAIKGLAYANGVVDMTNAILDCLDESEKFKEQIEVEDKNVSFKN